MSIPKWFIIINPVSGNKKGLNLWRRKIEAALIENKITYRPVFTEYPKHATFLVKQAIKEGFRHVLTIGGDGTYNEVINGIMEQNIIPSTDIIFTGIPAGTGNDWVRTMGLTQCPDTIIGLLTAGKIYTQDIGIATYHVDKQLQQRYFLNVAGLGFDAYVNYRMQNNSQKFGQLTYLFELIRSMFSYQFVPAIVRWKQQIISSAVYTVSVGICPYYGGGVKIAPNAIPNDGLFDVTLAKDLTKWELVKEIRNMYSGDFLGHPKVMDFRTDSLTIDSQTSGHLQLDGELAGETPITLKIIPKALNVLIPRDHTR